MKSLLTSIFLAFGMLSLALVWPYHFSPNLFIQESPIALKLWRDQEIKQTFIPEYPLKGVQLKFKAINDQDHPLTLGIGNATNRVHYQTTIAAQTLPHQTWQTVQLPVYLTSYQVLGLYLSSNTASETASLAPIVSSLDTYPHGEGTLVTPSLRMGKGYEVIFGDLAFKPIYWARGWEIVTYYLHRVAFAKPIPKILLLGIFLLWVGLGLSGMIWAGLTLSKGISLWWLGVVGVVGVGLWAIFFFTPPLIVLLQG